jgi:predicted lipoprotein with Yx(FWY)xxD motif
MRRMKLLGVLMVAGLALAACGKDDNGSSAAKSSTTTEAPSSTAANPGTGASTATVSVTPAAGAVKAHLVGPNGHALYLFEKDKGTTSACTTGCAAIWPGLTASGTPAGGTGVDAGKLSTADGQVANQVVYNGHLLYYYAGDVTATDTKGTSIPEWYLVSADGKSIED